MFKGQHEQYHPTKLPDNYAQLDQNGTRNKARIWRPRQGLARPSGVTQMSGKINALGPIEIGVSRGLMLADNTGVVHGYALGATAINPVWEPPTEGSLTPLVVTTTVDETGVVASWTTPSVYVEEYTVVVTNGSTGAIVAESTVEAAVGATVGSAVSSGVFSSPEAGVTYNVTVTPVYSTPAAPGSTPPAASSVATPALYFIERFGYPTGDLVGNGPWIAHPTYASLRTSGASAQLSTDGVLQGAQVTGYNVTSGSYIFGCQISISMILTKPLEEYEGFVSNFYMTVQRIASVVLVHNDYSETCYVVVNGVTQEYFSTSFSTAYSLKWHCVKQSGTDKSYGYTNSVLKSTYNEELTYPKSIVLSGRLTEVSDGGPVTAMAIALPYMYSV